MICMMAASGSVQVGVRQQREIARALDRRAELALVARLRAGDARGHDLPVLLHEVLQDVDVLVVDRLDLLRGEAAELPPLEQRVPAVALLAILLELALASSDGTRHVSFLPFASIRGSFGGSFRLPFRRSRCAVRASRRCGSGARESPRSASGFRAASSPATRRRHRTPPPPARTRLSALPRLPAARTHAEASSRAPECRPACSEGRRVPRWSRRASAGWSPVSRSPRVPRSVAS